MCADGRRNSDESSRLKQEAKQDQTDFDESSEELSSHKRRRPWKEEHRRGDRASKKQRQRNPEWND